MNSGASYRSNNYYVHRLSSSTILIHMKFNISMSDQCLSDNLNQSGTKLQRLVIFHIYHKNLCIVGAGGVLGSTFLP